MLVVLTLIVGCGKAEPTAALVPPADTLAPPTAVPELTSTPIPTPSGGGGVITFISNRDGSTALYAMAVPDGAEADGTDQRRLTDKYAVSYDWSPDGARIVFTSVRDERYEIYVMDADGTNQWQLTSSDDDDWWPAWSPDGMQIAFTSNRGGDDEIYAIAIADGPEADGNDPRQLTNHPCPFNVQPTWSPDGTQIAFTSDRDGNDEIYVMAVPDGTEADGTGQRRLTHNDADDRYPAWSPDGTQIVFTSRRDGNDEIYVMNADGSAQRRLTNTDANNWWPNWSLDGSQIVFQSSPIGTWNWNIYIMSADGTNQRQLTDNDAADEYPVWRP
jgi:Tol biopolymer transport system component